ncbi:MAG TPA: esterase-like activity of phytase family protein [Flavobacteriaceae bacterium]|nr:esterase-like activity of phytase family protein [Flavobacteriaceae bacterium]HIP26104.1 esterase-like activity of phytase family protein [Flavobacteriaceae bacterium]
MIKKTLQIGLIIIFLSNCKSSKITREKKTEIKELRFIGEKIIPAKTFFNKTLVGGLSSIDFVDGKYYLISDDKKKPYRFYEMELNYNQNNFSSANITNVIKLDTNVDGADPESLRFDKVTNQFYWASEGYIRKGIDPTIFEITKDGKKVRTHKTPDVFKANLSSKTNGIRRNGTFEGLSMSVNPNFYWIGMELPLKQDGSEPQLKKGEYPIRISKLNKKTDELVFQFAYLLDEITKNSIPENKFIVNGSPEILELDETHFLVIERAYASGHKDGGNTVKIYLVDCKDATDISNVNSLKGEEYRPAKKKLLFDFESIRSKLTNGVVDNIEGITFGKTLQNGNQTIVVVSDNNFNKFETQLNQIIVLEVIRD